MLLEKEKVLEILRCPKSGAKLERFADQLIAVSSEGKIGYKIIDDYPLLIDFDESILNVSDFYATRSIIKRRTYTGILDSFKRMVSPPKKVTAKNVNYITNSICKLNVVSRVLIVGGGTVGQGMDPFYYDPRLELVSFDIYASPYVQFLADAHCIPLPDNYFDVVVVQAVLEHVLNPIQVVSEIYRVLKKGGIVYAETPFLQHVHEGAYDFTRFTESGHRYLFKNFKLIDSGASAGAGTQLLWSLDNFFRGLFRSVKVGKVIKLCFFWLQYLDRLIPDAFNIDAASGVYFLGEKQKLKIDGKEMVAHYRGAQRGNIVASKTSGD